MAHVLFFLLQLLPYRTICSSVLVSTDVGDPLFGFFLLRAYHGQGDNPTQGTIEKVLPALPPFLYPYLDIQHRVLDTLYRTSM